MAQKITSSFRIEEDILIEAKKKAIDDKTTLSKVIEKLLTEYVTGDNQSTLKIE